MTMSCTRSLKTRQVAVSRSTGKEKLYIITITVSVSLQQPLAVLVLLVNVGSDSCRGSSRAGQVPHRYLGLPLAHILGVEGVGFDICVLRSAPCNASAAFDGVKVLSALASPNWADPGAANLRVPSRSDDRQGTSVSLSCKGALVSSALYMGAEVRGAVSLSERSWTVHPPIQALKNPRRVRKPSRKMEALAFRPASRSATSATPPASAEKPGAAAGSSEAHEKRGRRVGVPHSLKTSSSVSSNSCSTRKSKSNSKSERSFFLFLLLLPHLRAPKHRAEISSKAGIFAGSSGFTSSRRSSSSCLPIQRSALLGSRILGCRDLPGFFFFPAPT